VPPRTPPCGKILTYAQVLSYAYITVELIDFALKGPQNGVLGAILGGGQRYLVGTPYECYDCRSTHFQTSLVQI